MNKYEFIKYNAERYGIDESVAETIIDMFADSLQELLASGLSRSEEHTSELQSHHDLVCRLLLEKKKKQHKIHTTKKQN